MPYFSIVMPQLGEPDEEVMIVKLNIKVGDIIVEAQEVIEVETDKAAMTVETRCGGIVKKIIVKEGKHFEVGAVLAIIEASQEEIERTGVTPREFEEEEASTDGCQMSHTAPLMDSLVHRFLNLCTTLRPAPEFMSASMKHLLAY